MKQLIFLLCLFLVIGCKDDDDCQGIDCLPAATQTGENTFGCLVNGEAFVDNGIGNNFYQLVDGEFFFLVGGLSRSTASSQVIIASNSREVLEGDFNLECNSPDNFYGELSIKDTFLDLDTCDSSFGFLSLTKFDLNQNIASGAFEFDVIDPRDNSIIEIREGRFDVTLGR